MNFHRHILDIDARAESERIVGALRNRVHRALRRHGGVVGISGGVDSSVALALSVRAFGPQKVVAVMMPETDSSVESEGLARELARQYGVTPVLEDITGVLEGFDCYTRRDDAIRRVYPQFDAAAGYRSKVVLPQNLLDGGTLNVFSLVIVDPQGGEMTRPLGPREFLQIAAASNLKQRTRMAMLYFHAELNNFAVIGTANKNEHDQGFFVKYGDGGVDVQVIAHLYKTQVYQLAEYLGVPEAIRRRPPTTDTYSAPATQQEFFYRLPFETMDLLRFAQEHGVPAGEAAAAMGLTEAQVERAFHDFIGKHRTTNYLRMPPLSLEPESTAESAGLQA